MPWGLTRFQHSGQSHFVTFCCYHRRRLLTTDASRRIFESALERVRRSWLQVASAECGGDRVDGAGETKVPRFARDDNRHNGVCMTVNDIRVEIKIKVKGDGQECPSHTGIFDFR
jgi:hypothetical protein